MAVSFIDGGNRSTQGRKPPICRKSLTNFYHIIMYRVHTSDVFISPNFSFTWIISQLVWKYAKKVITFKNNPLTLYYIFLTFLYIYIYMYIYISNLEFVLVLNKLAPIYNQRSMINNSFLLSNRWFVKSSGATSTQKAKDAVASIRQYYAFVINGVSILWACWRNSGSLF